MSDVASKITITRPFSVYFTCGDLPYLYTIDAGGIRAQNDDVTHETPSGSFCFTDKTFDEIYGAANSLGARITPLPPVPSNDGVKK